MSILEEENPLGSKEKREAFNRGLDAAFDAHASLSPTQKRNYVRGVKRIVSTDTANGGAISLPQNERVAHVAFEKMRQNLQKRKLENS